MAIIKEELRLTDLIEVSTLQKMQDAFAAMTGVAVITTDSNGVAVTEPSDFSDFCINYVRSTEAGMECCEKCDKMGAEMARNAGDSCAYFCHAGLMDFAAPIMTGGHMVGCFIGGQVLTEPIEDKVVADVAKRIGVDENKLIEAAHGIKIVDKSEIKKVTAALYDIANVLSEIAFTKHELYLKNLELEKASHMKSDFLANMSHEIRTPMNAVIGMAEMALREDISPSAKNYISQIKSSGQALLTIINDILDFSKIESGKMDINETDYEPMSLINDVVNIIMTRISNKKLELTLDVNPDLPHELHGDNIRVKQIIVNLANNAVKFTDSGNVHLKIDFKQTKEDQIILKAEIADTGSGIKKQDMAKLFQSFQQVDSKRNRNIEGTGLGLAISHQLAELMNGEIKVDSIYQRGTTFTLILEQEIINKAPIGPIKDIMKGSFHEREEYRQSFEAPEARVLIVDDNDMNLMVAVKLLRATKVQVETASSGYECLEKTRQRFYHVIFMDHMMPKLDGIETLKKMRKQENGLCKETPVIALTANAFSNAEAFYNANGFDAYLVKPVNGALFEALLLKFLPREIVEVTSTSRNKEKEGSNVHMVYGRNKQPVCITTESVCDLPEDIMERFGIACIYYYVQTQEGRFHDVCEISADNLIEYIDKQHKAAYSMPPSVEEYETFFADALGNAQQVIHISMAKNSGEGYSIACQAAKGFDNVHVINSAHISSSMGILALYGAAMVQDGNPFQDVINALNHIKYNISTSFIVAHTNNLYRSGRMSKKVKDVCDLFLLHPVLSVKGS